MKHALLVGARGTVGSETQKILEKQGYIVIDSSSKEGRSDVYLDLTKQESIESLPEQLPELDALIIVAGKEPQQSLEELNWMHLQEMIAIHYSGPLWLIKQLKNKMKKNSGIVLISSVAANKGSYDPAYASLKSAVNGLVRTLSKELAPDISVCGIAPGLIEGSPVYKRMTDDFKDKHLNANINKKLLKAEEVAEAIFFLINQKQLTGQILHMNGGQYYGN